jgi:predicted RecA/RadA family phage recombinase
VDNFSQPGLVLPFTAPTDGVVSGTLYQIGQAVVAAVADAAEGATFEGLVRGVVSVEKPGSQAWTEGALVYFDAVAGKVTTVDAGNRLIGWATSAVGSGAGETTGECYLDGVARANEDT